MNEALVVSDGNEARVGTPTAGTEWFKPRRASPTMPASRSCN